MGKAQLRRALHIIAAVLILVLAVGLYKAKTDAARTEAHVRDLQGQIDDREAGLRALRAEIAHLESPARIEELAEDHLGVSVGSESAALPESAIAQRLPAPRAQKARE
jgi:cell division protein FtsL